MNLAVADMTAATFFFCTIHFSHPFCTPKWSFWHVFLHPTGGSAVIGYYKAVLRIHRGQTCKSFFSP